MIRFSFFSPFCWHSADAELPPQICPARAEASHYTRAPAHLAKKRKDCWQRRFCFKSAHCPKCSSRSCNIPSSSGSPSESGVGEAMSGAHGLATTATSDGHPVAISSSLPEQERATTFGLPTEASIRFAKTIMLSKSSECRGCLPRKRCRGFKPNWAINCLCKRARARASALLRFHAARPRALPWPSWMRKGLPASIFLSWRFSLALCHTLPRAIPRPFPRKSVEIHAETPEPPPSELLEQMATYGS